jgi:hypothetical protein
MISETRLGAALRKKYRTPADALKAIGLDPNLLEEEKAVSKPKLVYDEMVKMADGSYTPRGVLMAFDEKRRRARDDEPDDRGEGDPDDDGVEELRELLSGAIAGAFDAWGKKRAADRKRTAWDDPPEFSGRPETGGSMADPENSYSSVTGNDRRRGRAHDDGAVIIDEDFRKRFPEAARIRMS